jgi:IclR family transcriptional regulator, KDG regulon repressor
MKLETLKSLKKALEILNLFLNSNQELSMGEMIKLSGLSQSTTSRIVSVLVDYQYLKRREETGKYFPGSIFLAFYRILKTKMEARSTAIPFLIKLSRQVHEPVVLAFHNGTQDLLVEQISDTLMLDKVLVISANQTARILPLHCTCAGKIALASLPDEVLQKYLDNTRLTSYTPRTVTDPEKLLKDIKNIRKTGIIFENEEFEAGVRSVGTTLKDDEGNVIGSISIAAPTARLSRMQTKALAPILQFCSLEISRALGYKG